MATIREDSFIRAEGSEEKISGLISIRGHRSCDISYASPFAVHRDSKAVFQAINEWGVATWISFLQVSDL